MFSHENYAKTIFKTYYYVLYRKMFLIIKHFLEHNNMFFNYKTFFRT